MKCVLLNKNNAIAVLEYNEVLRGFDKVYKIINIDYAPLIINKYYEKNDDEVSFLRKLNEWFKGRGIPAWRDKLDLLLHKLNVESPSELLDKAFGLSLSDQYWIKPCGLDIKYDDINFFDHDFDYSEFLEASLSLNSSVIIKDESLKTPNNTTDGMLKKAWIIEDGVRYLLKGGYKSEILQPFNEALASEICSRLGFKYVKYTLDIYKDNVVSKCPCFINKDTEFIPASQIIYGTKKNKSFLDYENYINILGKNGIENAREKLENMYILDFLIMNEDRHLNNFGIIRDVNTLKWIDIAPIFDNGMALNINYYDDDSIATRGDGRLFYELKPFDEIIKVVKDIKRIDILKLDGIVEWYETLLTDYKNITKMSDERINKLCFLFNRQINRLKKLINNSR